MFLSYLLHMKTVPYPAKPKYYSMIYVGVHCELCYTRLRVCKVRNQPKYYIFPKLINGVPFCFLNGVAVVSRVNVDIVFLPYTVPPVHNRYSVLSFCSVLPLATHAFLQNAGYARQN